MTLYPFIFLFFYFILFSNFLFFLIFSIFLFFFYFLFFSLAVSAESRVTFSHISSKGYATVQWFLIIHTDIKRAACSSCAVLLSDTFSNLHLRGSVPVRTWE